MIGAAKVTLKRPITQNATIGETVKLKVVRVWERDPPGDESPIAWMLLPTEPRFRPDELAWNVDSDRARWANSGPTKGSSMRSRFSCPLPGNPWKCEVRRVPDALASTVLSETQLKVLRIVLGRMELPEAPTLPDALLAIAALGGHIEYSGDPGWLTLARVYSEMRSLTRAWEAAQLQSGGDQR